MNLPKPEPNSDPFGLSKCVAQLAEADVRAFLLHALQRDESLEYEFRLKFGMLDIADACRALRHKLDDLEEQHSYRGYIGYDDSFSVSLDYLDAIDEAVRPFRKSRDAAGLFAIADTVIDNLSQLQLHDFDGFCEDIFASVTDMWSRAFKILHGSPDVDERIDDLLQLAFRLRSGMHDGDFDDVTANMIEKFLADQFADDSAHAAAIVELADRHLAHSKRDFERLVADLHGRTGVKRGNPNPPYVYDCETPRWAAVRVRAMRAVGASTDEALAFARPYATSDDVLFVLYDTLVADDRRSEALALLEEALSGNELSPADRNRITLFLRDAYRDAGDTEKLRAILEQLLVESRGFGDPSAPSLLAELRAVVPEKQWKRVRDGVLKRMENPEARCDCLAAEGLADRLLTELKRGATSYRSPASYEKLLVVDHADVLVRWYVDRATMLMRAANNRKSYAEAAGTLAHLAQLPGGKPEAEELAQTWREKYPRRSALLDELSRAGF